MKETTPVKSTKVKLTYPITDNEVVARFEETVRSVKNAGQTPRVAIFDTISSMPGVLMPWERLVEVCKKEGVLSLVDGAHGAGHLDMDITGTQPDFLVTNLHKLVPC